MSELAVAGFRAERDAILDVAKSLTDDEWNAPSDCAGWTIRDVYAHLAYTMHGVVDPAYLPDTSGGIEGAMDQPVAERRSWSIEQVLEEYETSSAGAAEVFASLQAPPMSETPFALGELGTHPMAMLPAIFLFDGFCHLRNDILRPNGSIDRPAPPIDEQRMRPTLEWMMAGLPWMCAAELAALVDRPLAFEFTGVGGGAWTIGPGGDDGRVRLDEGAASDVAATVRSSGADFVVWGTQRRPWKDSVEIIGDEAYAASVLDVVNII